MQFPKRLQTWIDTTDVAGGRLPVRWLSIAGAAAACLLLAPWSGAEKQSAAGIGGAAMAIDPDPGNPISQPGPKIRYSPKADAPGSVRASSTRAKSDHVKSDRASSDRASSGRVISGRASYYGFSLAGNLTASGERFDPGDLTAAHPTLPFDTRVRVTNVANDRSVVVRINDRGPFVRGRIIDVSRTAADRLGMLRAGVADVRLAILGKE